MKKCLAGRFALFFTLVAGMLLALPAVSSVVEEAADQTEVAASGSSDVNVFTLSLAQTDGETHLYAVYQIFTGTAVETDEGEMTLSAIQTGENFSPYTISETDADGNESSVTYNDALSAVSYIMDAGGGLESTADTEKLELISCFVDFKSAPAAVITDASKSSASLEAGYYLIVDLGAAADSSADDASSVKDAEGNTYYYTALSGTDSYSLYLAVVLTEDEEGIEPKTAVPSVSKEVREVNDSESASDEGWGSYADSDIGDYILFRLTGTMPSDEIYDDVESYAYIFHDTMAAGLTLAYGTYGEISSYSDGSDNSSDYALRVTVYDSADDENGTVLEQGVSYTVTVSKGTDFSSAGTELMVALGYADENGNFVSDIMNMQDSYGNAVAVTSDSVITVEYAALFNEDAVIGNDGNLNTVYLEYSANPNNDSYAQTGAEETACTPEDSVLVYTYEIDITKVDADGNALAGAEFTLYKYLEDGGWQEIAVISGKASEDDADGSSEFVWSGLDEGIYRLVESDPPDGYMTMDDICFSIAAEISVSSETAGGYRLTGLRGIGLTASENEDGTWTFSEASSDSSEDVLTAGVLLSDEGESERVLSGILSGKVVNQEKILTLPSTGGKWLILLLCASAAAVFITALAARKKTAGKKETA